MVDLALADWALGLKTKAQANSRVEALRQTLDGGICQTVGQV